MWGDEREVNGCGDHDDDDDAAAAADDDDNDDDNDDDDDGDKLAMVMVEAQERVAN